MFIQSYGKSLGRHALNIQKYVSGQVHVQVQLAFLYLETMEIVQYKQKITYVLSWLKFILPSWLLTASLSSLDS